jgi:hypothetical protein
LRSDWGKKFVRPPHLHNNQSKMDWRCGLSGRAPISYRIILCGQSWVAVPTIVMLYSEHFLCHQDFWAGHWWLTSVILTTQEAEIRKITAQSQPGQIVHKTLS